MRYRFGCEEAIGFSVGPAVRDKDGIGAALVFAELAAECRAEGVSVLEKLEALYRRFGLWVSVQHSIVRSGVEGSREIARAVDRLAADAPASLDGIAVRGLTDYRKDAGRPFWISTSPLISLDLGANGRALLRPSGTEPKLKVYVDLRDESPGGGQFWEAETALRGRAAKIAAELARFVGFD